MDKTTKRVVRYNLTYLIGVILIAIAIIYGFGAVTIHLLKMVGLW